ncbi:MAG TPA: hypothetical protein VOA87_15595 [Thermoanaerobaculia bacterium]|nr:hypothetical protein [Thermoanaerobaculia bacterium]
MLLAWFFCATCGHSTRDGLTRAEALREWNALYGKPNGDGAPRPGGSPARPLS